MINRDNVSWNRRAMAGIGIAAVCLLLALIRDALNKEPPVPGGRPAVRDESPDRTSLEGGGKHPDPLEATRIEPANMGDLVGITVKDENGNPVDTAIVGDRNRPVVRGVAYLPRESGRVAVSAPGFVSQVVLVESDAIDVVLRQAVALSGFVYDASSSGPLEGVSLRATLPTAGNTSLADALQVKTDAEGKFLFEGLPRGRVTLSGDAPGYVPLCSSPTAPASGIVIDVASDKHVDAPMFPIVVCLCQVQNGTNLSDEVLGSMLTCGFSSHPGVTPPGWCDRATSATIAEVSRAAGLTLAYGESCILPMAPDSLRGKASFFAGGRDLGRVDVDFQRLTEFLAKPSWTVHIITASWDIGSVILESPIPLRICESGSSFGGLVTTPGSCSFQLPRGSYFVGPLDNNVLLNPSVWTRKFRVPEDNKVVISPDEGLATLELRRGDGWPGGVLRCTGPGGTLGIPLESLPFSMPVTPGSYEFDVFVAEGSDVTTVWKGTVTLSAGESKVLQPSRQ